MKRVDYLNRIPISLRTHVTNEGSSAKHDLNYTESNVGQGQASELVVHTRTRSPKLKSL